jgi:hypothetical protein
VKGANVMNANTTRSPIWSTAPELPLDVFNIWHKPDGAISPVAVVATVDEDGWPRTAPFGSLRAVTPKQLRLCSMHGHDTYSNLRRDGRVIVTLISPPDISVSVRGRARLVKERLDHDEHFAILEIDIEEVKNDMAYRIVIDSSISITPRQKYKAWYEEIMRELA